MDKPICYCIGIDFGTYENTIPMKPPFRLKTMDGKVKKNQWVDIDICIATDIARLWKNGVKTLGCCCGHGKIKPTVVVDRKSVGIMKVLGYKKIEGVNDPFEL